MRRQLISRRLSMKGPRSRSRRAGKGQAWLIFDAGGELFKYQCYWMGGHCDDHLIEHGQAVTDVDAVAWGAARTPRSRIRMPNHVTYWAGFGPRPNGFSRSWQPPKETANPVDSAVPVRAAI